MPPQDKVHVVYLGETGFPYGMAAIQRQLLISMGLVEAGAEMLVISNKGVHDLNDRSVEAKGKFENVPYIYTSGTPYRPQSFGKRNLLKLTGLFNELQLLVQLKRSGKLQYAIVATMRFQSILLYFLISRVLGFKVLLNYVEKNSSITTRTSFNDRINDWLLDKVGLNCCDAILPISTYLETYARSKVPSKPSLRIPIIGRYSEFDNSSSQPSTPPYFLYCGSASYAELISFIIDAFENIPNNKQCQLFLVVNGDIDEMERFREIVQQSRKSDQIKVFTRLPYTDLLTKYNEATALLIPLRPTEQDLARFPHKIGEYLASGRPMVSTRYGEIAHYFTDEVDAFIAEEYDVMLFSQKMSKILDDPTKSRQVGKTGKVLGIKEFDYKAQGQKLFSFIQDL